MTRGIRRAGCLLIALIILPAAAFAGTIDNLIDLLTRPADHAVAMEISAEVIRLPEMGEERTEWLNRLLSHIIFRTREYGEIREEIIEIDGIPGFGCVSRRGENDTLWQFTFDQTAAYSLPDGTDMIASLAGTDPDLSRLDYYSDTAVLLSGFYRFFEGLPSVFPEACTLSKVNNHYKPYGTAVKKWSITLTEDVLQSEKMIAYLDGEGMEDVKEYLSHVVLSGRQRLTLLMDEDDHLMKVNYTARAGLSPDDLRNVNLDWRCFRRSEGYRDVLQLTTPGSGRKDNLSITQEMVIDEEGNEDYTGTVETDQVADRVRTRTVLTFHLKASGSTVTGEILEKKSTPGKTESTAVTVSLEQNTQDEYRGSLEIICNLDKIEKEHFRISLIAGRSEPPKWNDAPVRQMTETARKAVAEKAAQTLLSALAHVPEEDLQYILADLPAGLWAEMTRKTEIPEETEKP